MSKKILTRLSLFLLVLFGITILTFIYTNLSPVDAAEALAVRRYSRPTPEQVELVREELGLDKPLIQVLGCGTRYMEILEIPTIQAALSSKN